MQNAPAGRRCLYCPMRLNATEHRAIVQAVHEHWPTGTRVLLFGSRVDDGRRGGDIDLMVELPRAVDAAEVVDRRNRFVARLYRLLDERRIDVIVADPDEGAPTESVVQQARQQGIELARI